MPNFPGSNNAVPGVYSEVVTIPQGVSVPSGTRVPALMGEGIRQERLVSSAVGDGNDGLNPEYTSTTGSDGRHFLLSLFPIISNRTEVYKNGILLSGVEQAVDNMSFNNKFEYRIDIATGQIQLQAAQLVDQGGSFFAASDLNVGNGTISGLTLLDENAPTEVWTIRCTSVRRDGYGDPIDGYARFIAQGSVSGILLDGYGNNIVWQSNGVTNDNGILQFSISEGAVPFVEGDRFTVEVKGGALVAGDSLVVNYIAELDINDPEFFTSMDFLTQKHGPASLENRLSLGSQLAFANATVGVLAVQTAPSIPRRQSFVVEESASGGTASDDLQFALPTNIVPDADTNINFFVTDPVTGEETQILPNKVDFYDPTITASPDSFHFGPSFTFSYTVILDDAIEKEDNDGVVTPVTGTTGTLSSVGVQFGLDDLSATRSVKIFNASNPTNNGTFTVVSVADGIITLLNPAGFVAESDLEFQVLDSAAQSARILWTDDLALATGASLRTTVIDTKDADFFDAGWLNAYEALEREDCDIVTPLPSQTISAIFGNGKAHVRKMSDIKNRKERVLFIGAVRGLTPDNLIGNDPAAVEDIGILEGIQGDEVSEILAGNIEDLANYSVQDAFGDTFRVAYFWPDEIVIQAGADRVLADGFFLAAAAAGFYAGTPNTNVTLTNKTLTGFTILRNKLLSPITLENLTTAGVTVLQPVLGGGLVIHARTTTDGGSPSEEEQSVVFIRDRIAKDLRKGFQGFIGVAETPQFAASLFARADGIMKSFISRRLITQFRDLEVKRDEVDPRQWNISVAAQPVFPVNWIFIRTEVGVL